ncbi:MAG: 50S ribosomal protein L30 [Lewinellaceae bacterium]|jgi:large subunit ribosomal protein L30|nr:50S ribosomal protein L30 [Lewinellaceae bacterium]
MLNNKQQINRLMSKVKITLVKSPIDKTKRQKATLTALGFNKMHQTIEHDDTPQIQGMIRVVSHLVEVNKG